MWGKQKLGKLFKGLGLLAFALSPWEYFWANLVKDKYVEWSRVAPLVPVRPTKINQQPVYLQNFKELSQSQKELPADLLSQGAKQMLMV